jgi:CheY-like chemotaxis protein
VLEVVDNGTGMDEATRARIFEPFFTTKPSGEGSGLGLAMVYGVIKQSEGHVMVESAPGRGARFSVLLPFAREAAEPTVPEGVPSSGSHDATVLVVEDEAMIRNVVANALRGEGYRVRVAQNGEDALALVRREALSIDLLLTDVVMPKLGGVRLAEALHRTQTGLRVLFISGYSEDLVASGHVGNHDDLFLAKPFTSQALLEQVARALSRPVGSANVTRR